MSDVCSGNCGSCGQESPCAEAVLPKRPFDFSHALLVLSGKGGVGKSSVAVNLALYLATEGYRVGLLDVDFHGPSIPTMLGLQNAGVLMAGDELLPREIGALKVMSMGFLIQDNKEAVIWRGPMKGSVMEQLMRNVQWGELDYLVLDLPPGTGDEALSACQILEDVPRSALVVTTPQEVSLSDCRRCISFCKQVGLPILGVVENMSGFICPDCGKEVDIFGSGGGESMAAQEQVPFLGEIPLDPSMVLAGDHGKGIMQNFVGSPGAVAFEELAGRVVSEAARRAGEQKEKG